MFHMDTNKLIDHIIQEVMKRMGKTDSKALAIAFSEKNINNFSGVYIDYFEDLSEKVNVSDYEYILLGNISNKELAYIALGIQGDPVSSLVVKGILSGKKIFILEGGFEYRKYKETSNIVFYNMLQEYEKKLKSFGIEFVEKSELPDLFQENHDRNPSDFDVVSQTESFPIQERIITEDVIKTAFMNGYRSITTKKNAIMTPLARDYIRTNQIHNGGNHL